MPGGKLLSSHRLAYEVMKGQIEADGQYILNNENKAKELKKNNIRAAQSYLWSQVPITPASSSYVFQVKNGVANIGNPGLLPMETRLKDQDVFFTYALGFYLLCTSTGFSNTSYQFNLMTFPSADFFGSLPGGVPIETLLGIWTSGSLNVKVNGETLTPQWDLGQHLHIPQTQILAAPGPSSTAPFFDQKDLSEDGFVITEPNWIINGGNDNQYQAVYPQNWGAVGVPDPTTTNWRFSLVMKWQGFLAQNASTIMNPGGK